MHNARRGGAARLHPATCNPLSRPLLTLPAHRAPAPYTAVAPQKYHWDYFTQNPGQPYCQFVVAPKVAKFRSKWAAKLVK